MADTLQRMELMFILRPDLTEAKRKAAIKEVKTGITEIGGKVFHEDNWERRKLAYRIKGFEEGYYHILYFEGADAAQFTEMERNLRINQNVIRHMLVQLPKGYEIIHYDLDADPYAQDEKESKGKKSSSAKKAPAKKKANLDKKLDEIIKDDDINVK